MPNYYDTNLIKIPYKNRVRCKYRKNFFVPEFTPVCFLLICPFFVDMKLKKPKYADQQLSALMIERIRELRNEHCHTQEYVIENTGVDVSHIENGRDTPSVASISRLCKLYGITLGEFFAPLDYPPKERK